MQNKGGRPATGSVKWKRNAKTGVMQWHARVTFPDKSRRWVDLDPSIPEHDEAAARTCAKDTSDEVRGGNYAATSRKTVTEWTEDWLKVRKERGLTSVSDDRSRLALHVLPFIGALAMRHVTRTHVEELVQTLDRRVRAGEIGWKTAEHAWSLVRGMFKAAVSSKHLDLRVGRDDNPTHGVEGPDRGNRKAKQYLYPSEFLTLVSSDKVPLRWRRAIALAVYSYARAGELQALDWSAVDLERGVLHIHQSIDRRRTKQVKGTKTDTARRLPIERELLPLFEALHDETGGDGPVFDMPSPTTLSRKLKFYIERVGIKRVELLTSDATRKAITWHDLRATGITWCAVRGDDALKIKQRCGHQSFATTELYVREAENLRESFGEVFPPLPSDLLGGFGSVSALGSARRTQQPFLPGSGWPLRGSKPTEKTTDGAEVSRENDASSAEADTKPDEGQQPKPEAVDAVEAALANALESATTAGRWDVVAQLARELSSRREAALGVSELAVARRRRSR